MITRETDYALRLLRTLRDGERRTAAEAAERELLEVMRVSVQKDSDRVLLEILPDWELADGTPVGRVPEAERVGKARRI